MANDFDKKFLSTSSWFNVDQLTSSVERAIKRELVRNFTEEGSIIFDPFLRNGETLFACHDLKRNAISLTNNNEDFDEVNEKIRILESQLQLSDYGSKQKSKQVLLKAKVKDFDYLWQQYQLSELDMVITFLPTYQELCQFSEENFPGQEINVLLMLEKLFTELNSKIKLGAYIIVLTENYYYETQYHNFIGQFIEMMNKHLQLKGQKIMCLGNNATSDELRNMSVTHKNLLFFRKIEL